MKSSNQLTKWLQLWTVPTETVCVTLLRYIVDKPEGSYAQVRLFGGNKKNEKFQQIVYVK